MRREERAWQHLRVAYNLPTYPLTLSLSLSLSPFLLCPPYIINLNKNNMAWHGVTVARHFTWAVTMAMGVKQAGHCVLGHCRGLFARRQYGGLLSHIAPSFIEKMTTNNI